MKVFTRTTSACSVDSRGKSTHLFTEQCLNLCQKYLLVLIRSFCSDLFVNLTTSLTNQPKLHNYYVKLELVLVFQFLSY